MSASDDGVGDGTRVAPRRVMTIPVHNANQAADAARRNEINGAGSCRVNTFNNTDDGKIVYWHHELPPLDAEFVAEHTVEATSGRVAGTLSDRNNLWDRCYLELMANTQARLAQEIARFGGDYAHVHNESIDT